MILADVWLDAFLAQANDLSIVRAHSEVSGIAADVADTVLGVPVWVSPFIPYGVIGTKDANGRITWRDCRSEVSDD